MAVEALESCLEVEAGRPPWPGPGGDRMAELIGIEVVSDGPTRGGGGGINGPWNIELIIFHNLNNIMVENSCALLYVCVLN